jgi:hypothetical protein
MHLQNPALSASPLRPQDEVQKKRLDLQVMRQFSWK